jgi:hypothetical protein
MMNRRVSKCETLNQHFFLIKYLWLEKYLKELKQKRLRFNDENELPKQKKKKALKLEHETD